VSLWFADIDIKGCILFKKPANFIFKIYLIYQGLTLGVSGRFWCCLYLVILKHQLKKSL